MIGTDITGAIFSPEFLVKSRPGANLSRDQRAQQYQPCPSANVPARALEYGCAELFQALSNLKRRRISRSRHFAERVQMRLVIHSSDVIAGKSYGSDITSRRSACYVAVARGPGIIG